jgi:DNA (cytosine-5)-methyltransferase 1
MSFKKEKIKYFDLFAGIGGFKIAADTLQSSLYSFEHIGYCEIDKKARDFYNKVHNTGSIQSVDNVQSIQTANNINGIKVNDFDMLFAGFPCQSFSNIGYRKGFDDSRGQLFFDILNIIDFYNPKYFILENVQKLSTIEKGRVLNEMSEALKNIGIGYNLHVWELLASDYGLPQNRRRIFFCGVRQDIKRKIDLPAPPIINLLQSQYPTVWHLLEKSIVDNRHFIPTKTRETVLYKNPRWQGNVNIDNPIARPLTASMSKWHRANQDNYYSSSYIFGSEPYFRPNVVLEDEPIRRITPLEGFRLQGFPDNFSKKAKESNISYATQYRLIGNAVPVNLAQNVIKHLLNSYLI